MEQLKIRTTTVSNGRFSIPLEIEKKMKLKNGMKFVIINQGDTILLKKIYIPRFENFDNLIKRSRKFAKEKQIKLEDVKKAIKKVRAK